MSTEPLWEYSPELLAEGDRQLKEFLDSDSIYGELQIVDATDVFLSPICVSKAVLNIKTAHNAYAQYMIVVATNWPTLHGKWVKNLQADYAYDAEDVVLPNEVLGLGYAPQTNYIPLGYSK